MSDTLYLCVKPDVPKKHGWDVLVVKKNWARSNPQDSFVRYVGQLDQRSIPNLSNADIMEFVSGWDPLYYSKALKLVSYGIKYSKVFCH